MHGAGARKATKGVELVGIEVTVTCPKKPGKTFKLKKDDFSWSHASSECEMCGDHGYFGVEYKCKCGEYHFLLLEDW